jgi:hypothetical protein
MAISMILKKSRHKQANPGGFAPNYQRRLRASQWAASDSRRGGCVGDVLHENRVGAVKKVSGRGWKRTPARETITWMFAQIFGSVPASFKSA